MQNYYTKQPLTIAEQISKLKTLGLAIEDETVAENTLGEISYFRFAAYLRPMEEDKLTHRFKQGATFSNSMG